MSSPPPQSDDSKWRRSRQQELQASGDEDGRPSPTLYNLIMTPLNFVSFLFSLFLIDRHYAELRSRAHSRAAGHLPAWLYRLLYLPAPYESYPAVGQDDRGRWYYHSKQRKLMRMEAEEAFRFRSRILVLLTVAAAVATGGAWYLLRRAYHFWYPV